MTDLKVLCKQESMKQMQEIINMNINELVQCWQPATDKTERWASGEDELLPATDGFPKGLGTAALCWAISQSPADART